VLFRSPEDLAEVVVVDNGSSDDSIELLKSSFPETRIIPLDENCGFAGGYNKAIEQIESEYAVLLNSDVEVTHGWLEAPLAVLETDTSVAGVQPKIRAEKQKDHFEYAGASGGYMDRYGYPFCRGRIMHVVEKDEGQYDNTADILWGSGACLFIRTALYRESGGLDATFFAHQEEIDLCWRLRSRGYRMVSTPQSVVYHVGGATLHTGSPQKTFLNFRNNLLMLYKNLPDEELASVMCIRFWLDYLAALRFLLNGHPQNAKAVYDARKAFFQLKPEYQSIRRENLQKTSNHSIPEILKKSLLIAFYLKGQKKFNALAFKPSQTR
jgi:GT2 family glycosyltransferase